MQIVGERKAAAARLAEIIGAKAVYTKMPRCAYEVGPYAIERDGSVTVSESAELAPLSTLAQEGLLEGFDASERAHEEEESKEAQEAPERATEVQETSGSAAEGDAAESSTEQSDTDGETQESVENEQTEEGRPDTLTISMPLTGHTASSLRNLVTMVYSRGSLLTKATGGRFSCTLEQVEAMKGCVTVEDVLAHLTPDLIGLTVEDDHISFSGFPFIEDADRIKAFTQLAAQMNMAAKERKRIQLKAIDATNEKYIFRIWLLSLGMGGEEFKTARRILLAPLSGSAAFITPAIKYPHY